jgi:ribosome-associated protein
LSEKLTDALAEAKRITNFEGKRRQIQFIGKLMRLLQASAPETIVAIQAALVEQNSGSAESALLVHQAEQWRDRLIASDGALVDWLTAHPSTDTQALRSLIRQARKDAITPITPTTLPALARQAGLRQGHTHGHAYREIFQCVRDQLNESIEPTVS